MRIKKGFTLAEILIVLMVIGIIATMTIPGLMKGVQENQLKTSYKKAYNNIVNWAAMASVAGELPAKGTEVNAKDVYISLARNLSVKGFIPSYKPNQSQQDNLSTMVSAVSITGSTGTATTIGNGTATALDETAKASYSSSGDNPLAMIITEDNMAYGVYRGTGNNGTCSTKLAINNETTPAGMAGQACFIIVVDVNGLNKTPNLYEPQMLLANGLATGTATATLTGDQYFIYLGTDGATAGNPRNSLTGRLIGDVKS